ncbi:MAG: hypothetical protein LBH22_02425 [Bacteroidales bacterium]|jgi:hypothetical protein|nr:hypothetical protein [Bacteroidales bacterium]
MKDKIKKFFKHPLVVRVLGTLIASLILLVTPIVFGWFELSDVLNALKTAFVFEVQIWIVLSILLLLAVGFLLVKHFKKTPNYTEDKFGKLNLMWRWDLEKNGEKWEVINLFPYCSECDMPMSETFEDYDSGNENYLCTNCDCCYYYIDPKIIKQKILDNIKRGKIKKTRTS